MRQQTGASQQRTQEVLRAAIAQEIARLSNATSLITVVGVVYDAAHREAKVAVSVYPEYKTPEALAFLRRHARDIARVAAKAIGKRSLRLVFPPTPPKS